MKREVAITKIATFAALGELDKLSSEIESSLVSKALSENEIGEICLQLYAYAGFPRSLNAQNALSSVVKRLSENGVDFDKGKEPDDVPSDAKYENGREVINRIFGLDAKQPRPESTGFAKATDVFLKEHLFNDITSRNNLSEKDRELATASMLAALGNVEKQLKAHLKGVLNTGTSSAFLFSHWLSLIAQTCSLEKAKKAESALLSVTDNTGFDVSYKMAREEAEKLDSFGIGEANTAYAKYFIGNSYLKPLTNIQSGEMPIFNVTFEPSCRNNWHIHHSKSGGGQVLICTAGSGWYQEWGKEAVSLECGKVIFIKANVKHWHGAKKDSYFSHITFEVPDVDTSNEWLEAVTDKEYNKLG